MSVDLHLARRLVAWGLGIAALTPLLFCFYLEPPAEQQDLSTVTGRITYSGRPIRNMSICLDTDGGHSALGCLNDDGTFRLINYLHGEDGTSRADIAHTCISARTPRTSPSSIRIPGRPAWRFTSLRIGVT